MPKKTIPIAMFLPLITSKLKKSDRLFLLLILLVFIWTLIFIWLGFAKYDGFFTGFQDLGIYDQVVWNTLHGRWFYTSLQFLPGHNLLAQHGEVAVLLLLPFYAVFAHPKILIFLQIAGIYSAAFPLYLMAIKELKNHFLAFFIALSFLLYPPLEWAALFEFNTITLTVPFFLWGIFFLSRKKHLWYMFFLLLALSTKEIVFIAAFIFGLYLYFAKIDKKIGKVTVTVSLVLGILIFGLLIPSLNKGGSHPLLSYFSDHPTDYFSILSFSNSIFSRDNFRFAAQLLVPLAFLPLFSPWLIAPVFPQLMLHFLAIKPEMKLINFHYSSLMAVFFFLALINTLKKFRLKQQMVKLMISTLLIFSIITNYLYSPSPLSRHFEKPPYLNPAITRLINDKLRTIPHDKTVALTQRLGSHLSQRQDLYLYPEGMDKADYLVLDKINFPPHPWVIASYQEKRSSLEKDIIDIKKDSHYVILAEDENLVIFTKRP